MPILYCPRCSKILTYGQVFGKNVTTSSSGPFIVGHPLGNANLPLIGVPLNSSSSRYAQFCKVCGEEINEIPTDEEREQNKTKYEAEQREKNGFLIIFFIIVGIIAFFEIVYCLNKYH